MGCSLFWVNFGNEFAYFVVLFTSQMAQLPNINFCFDCKTRLPYSSSQARENISLHKKVFYLQGTLGDINEHVTSILDCKHKHMMKRGAPPDKFGVLYRIVTYRISWFHKKN